MSECPKWIDSINNPDDLKKLTLKECETLACEIRERMIEVVSKTGGHLASNLGVVELTIALHRVLSTPNDILIWDVGHQCYTHKILTGRNHSFDTIRQKDGISGFPKPSESIYDQMPTGHASTSISVALGMLKARRLQGLSGKAVAVIGDGALTGGMAFEALNHAGHLKEDLIIILNDNDMSISRNVGALSSCPRPTRISAFFSQIAISPYYQRRKRRWDRLAALLPFGAQFFARLRHRIRKSIKALVLKENIFGELGFIYVGPIKGHNIKKIEKVLKRVKMLHQPAVIHLLTQKGKGYLPAEVDPLTFHGVGAFNMVDGKMDKKSSLTFTDCFSQLMLNSAEKDSKIVAVSAAMISGTGLSLFAARYPDRIFDVGIAEQHAVTFSAGLASQGLKPVVAIYSTFMQRAVDQVIHDVAIPKLPVIFVMSRSGFVPEDGETHQGLYDIALFRSIPNLSLLAPSGAGDFELMFEYARKLNGPILIRIPKALCSFSQVLYQPIEKGRGIFIHRCSESKTVNKILLVSVGGTFDLIEETLNGLARNGIFADHYNLRFIKPLAEEKILEDFSGYQLIVLAEDGAMLGGVGEKIQSLFFQKQVLQKPTIKIFAAPDLFLPQASRNELFEMSGCNPKNIIEWIKKNYS